MEERIERRLESTLPATHLLRQFLLFALVVVFLLLLIRAGYALWQFPAVEAGGAPERLFLTGLRFDLSLVGIVCVVPLVLGSLLAMFEATRVLAKGLVVAFLIGGLALVLLTELVTPHFLDSAGARPDAASFSDAPRLGETLVALVARHPMPSAVGVLLALMILVAYVARMQSGRFLRYRLSRPSALALALLGGVLCVVAARSALDPRAAALSLEDARLGGPPMVDALATNSAWTTLHSLVGPLP